MRGSRRRVSVNSENRHLHGLAVNIESSTNLSSWQVVGTKVLVGGTNYYSASPNPALGAQFYRAHMR
jgi:hypothetical protein